MRDRVRRHPIACFFAVSFAVTWGAWLAVVASGVRVGVGTSPLYLVGLTGPLAGAVVATASASGRAGLRDLLVRSIRVRIGLQW